MARAQIAYLNREDVPARKPLQAAIQQLGFKLALDDSYEPFETKGYLPCTMDGEDAGFDLRFQHVEEGLSSNLSSAIGGRDTAMKFRWAGDPREQFAALAVCAALVEKFGAIVHEPEGDRLLALDELLEKARKASESL
ncbi:MAG TPA: hypothetical protein VIF61_15815 [Methylocystis sp.]|jgi:hypothetical protein